MRAAGSRHPSPLGAATASAAFPGWGQVRVGYRRTGSALIAGSLVFLAASAAAVAVDGFPEMIRWLVDPELLLTILLLNLVIASVRICSTTHAWLMAGGRLVSLGLMVMLLLVAIPHVALGVYGLETRSTLLSVFPTEEPGTVALAETTTTEERVATTTQPATTTTLDTTSSGQIRLLVPELMLPTITAATTTTTTLPLGTERFSLLLLGVDSGPGRSGARTDTMIVASVDTVTGDAALFGLPRDMGGFTFSDGSTFPGLSRGLLNEVYQWGWRNPDRFGGTDPGAAAVSDVASTLLGIEIDHYVLVDMVGFAEVVDVLGGLTVDVNRELLAPLYDRSNGSHTMITIPAGQQALSGDLALAFARSRTGSNDYARMARQRCLLTALGSQLEPLRIFGSFPTLLDTIRNRVTTDIPLSKIPYIVNLAPNLAAERVIVVGFDRNYRSGFTSNGLPTPDVPRIQAEVQNALVAQIPEDSGLSFASGACST
ncbi:MAG: LCP family protein [Acidimicrobiia bacterium]